MPALLVVAPEPLAGKTTLAAGLAQRLKEEGRSAALLRLAGDGHAVADASLFASLPFNARPQREPLDPAQALGAAEGAEMALIEVPGGDPAETLKALGPAARALVVASGEASPGQVAQYCRGLGGSPAGLILNRVPQRRREAIRAAFGAAGLQPLALLPEDRTLAAPTLGQVAEAVQARGSFLNANRERLLERPLIASISADPGQGYFVRHQPSAVIVRGDKPDLQLAALNAGLPCLIITGGLTPLSCVLDRSEEEGIPILLTELDTVAAAQRIEAMFAATPFGAGEVKMQRLKEMLGEVDVSALVGGK